MALGYKEESWALQLLPEAYFAVSLLNPQNVATAAAISHASTARAGLLATAQKREGLHYDFKTGVSLANGNAKLGTTVHIPDPSCDCPVL